jgi:hypothetical protein
MFKTIAFLGVASVSSIICGVQLHNVEEGLALFAGLTGSYLIGFIHHGNKK